MKASRNIDLVIFISKRAGSVEFSASLDKLLKILSTPRTTVLLRDCYLAMMPRCPPSHQLKERQKSPSSVPTVVRRDCQLVASVFVRTCCETARHDNKQEHLFRRLLDEFHHLGHVDHLTNLAALMRTNKQFAKMQTVSSRPNSRHIRSPTSGPCPTSSGHFSNKAVSKSLGSKPCPHRHVSERPRDLQKNRYSEASSTQRCTFDLRQPWQPELHTSAHPKRAD